MDPSTTIKIKKAIVQEMAPLGWDEIDLVLNEFGLQTIDDWGGSSSSYIISALSGVDFSLLRAIGLHFGLGIDPGGDVDAPLPIFWKPGYFRLFTSHISAQKERAKRLKTCLESFGISSFVAHEDINPTFDWQREIESGLRTMHALLAIVTPGFRESIWADQEIGFALGRGILVVPLRVDGTDPHGFVARNQAVLVPSGSLVGDVTQRIFEVLKANENTSYALANALTTQIEQSSSKSQTRSILKLLDGFNVLDQVQFQRLLLSYSDNKHVNGEPTARESINALLLRHGLADKLIKAPIDEDDIPF